MPITTADKKTIALVQKLIDDDFPDLKEAKVRVGVFTKFARRNKKTYEPTGPAIKLNGYPCKAIAKISSHEQRVAGEADCRIIIDGDSMSEWSPLELEALLAHELFHFTVARTKAKFRGRGRKRREVEPGGQIRLDDSFRPVLRMRLHDIQIGVFREIAERYGDASADYQAVQQLVDASGQLCFPWVEVEEKQPRKREAAAV